jgi:hypothetical protein
VLFRKVAECTGVLRLDATRLALEVLRLPWHARLDEVILRLCHLREAGGLPSQACKPSTSYVNVPMCRKIVVANLNRVMV